MKINKQAGSVVPIIAAVLVILIVGAVGVVFLSRNAAPGDPLYNVRVLKEGIQYALTPSAISKAELALNNSRIVANQIKTGANQSNPSPDHIEAGASVLANIIQQATQAIGQVHPDTASPADKAKTASVVSNLINNTQSATTTLQVAAIKVPAASPDAKQAIQKIQATLPQQVAALQASGGGTSSSSSSSSPSSSNNSTCFSSITSQTNGQAPVSKTSDKCNSVLTLSGTQTYSGTTPVAPPATPAPSTPPTPRPTPTGSNSSSCHSISTTTINGVTTTKESFTCGSVSSSSPNYFDVNSYTVAPH